MYTKRTLLAVLVASAVILAIGIGPRAADNVYALPPAQEPDPAGLTISYPGRLSDDAGQPVADGAYDFTFALYELPEGGEPLWLETQMDVMVADGAFVAALGSVEALSKETLGSEVRWLEVAVRGPGEAEFTALAPRQEVGEAAQVAPASPAAPTALSCVHDHYGETWQGTGSTTGLYVQSTGAGNGLYGRSASGYGVYGASTSSRGVYGASTSSEGVRGTTSGDGWAGVSGVNTRTTGSGVGVWGQVGTGNSATGVYGLTTSSSGISYGVQGVASSSLSYGVKGSNTSGVGVYGRSTSGTGIAAESNTGNPIVAYGGAAPASKVMRVSSTGRGYFNGGYQTGGADVAEFITSSDDVQPGDVVEIDPEHPGQFRLAATPNSTAVAGVISTDPGASLGATDPANTENTGPQLALAGRVPVKVSAENGNIQPGDLLVASSTPGHAMRAPDNPAPGTVIGKALGSLDSGTGIIEMLAMLR